MRHGITTINEIRMERGLDPVPWGDVPWLDLNKAPANFPDSHRLPPQVDREDFSRYTGRNRRPKDDPNAVMSPDESDATADNDMT